MQCFKHSNQAVGLCSSCHQGVCYECAQLTSGRQLICDNADCHANACAKVKLAKQQQKMIKKTRIEAQRLRLMYFILGVIFVGTGVHCFLANYHKMLFLLMNTTGILFLFASFGQKTD